MKSAPLAAGRFTGIAAPAFLLAGAILAQASQQTSGLAKLRQPRPQTGQHQEELQTSPDKSRADMDKKFHDLDRRMNRTMRSVCGGC